MTEQPLTKKANKQTTITPIVFDLRQAAASLGICLTTLRKEIDRGLLRTIRIGRRRAVTPAALDEYVAAKERAAR